MKNLTSLRWVFAIAFIWFVGSSAAQTLVTTPFPGISVTSGNPTGVQLSVVAHTINVTTSGILEIEFTTSPTHCSNVFIQFELDGSPTALYRTPTSIGAGVSTGFINLGPVSAGAHSIAIRAEGVTGGCNIGTLSGWGGSATVRTSAAAVPIVVPTSTAVPTLGSTAIFALIISMIVLGFRLQVKILR